MLGSTESEKVRLISHEIIFAEFQPISQRHRQTCRRTVALAIPRSARFRAKKRLRLRTLAAVKRTESVAGVPNWNRVDIYLQLPFSIF